MAGEGVEYDWGCAKLDFRRTNLLVPKRFHVNVMASLSTIDRRKRLMFSRRARSYRNALKELHATGTCSFDKIEQTVAKYKTHRNAVDFDSAFLKALPDGSHIVHEGSAAHRETYAESVAIIAKAKTRFAPATVTNPSKGRGEKRNQAAPVEIEHARLEKEKRRAAAVKWTMSVVNRICNL